MAVKKEAISARSVITPRADPTAAGCEKLAEFLMTALKQAICVCEELENIRRMADPSKSGIAKAILGIADTSCVDTGILACPKIGTLAFNGQRLRELVYWLFNSVGNNLT
jgi:hypothetical protein